jgi:hypothetical protein
VSQDHTVPAVTAGEIDDQLPFQGSEKTIGEIKHVLESVVDAAVESGEAKVGIEKRPVPFVVEGTFGWFGRHSASRSRSVAPPEPRRCACK